MSIKQVLILSIIGLMLVTVSTIMLSTYFSTEAVLLGHAQKIMKNVAEDTIDRSIGFLEPAQAAADLTQSLANHNVVSDTNLDDMERYFYEQLKLYPSFSGIYYGTKNGGMTFVMRSNEVAEKGYRTKLISYDEGERIVELIWRDQNFNELKRTFDLSDSYDPRIRPWYKKAIAKKGLIWTDPYIFFSSQQPGITTASPVYSNHGESDISGVIGVDIEISEISTFLSKLKIGNNGSAFILNQNADVIAHPNPEKIKQAKADGSGGLTFRNIRDLDDTKARTAFGSLVMGNGNIAIDKQVVTAFELNKVKYQAIFAPFKNEHWPWIIGIYVPENDYLGVFKKNQKDNLIWAVLIGIVATLLGALLARSMIKPITALGDQSHSLIEDSFEEVKSIQTPYREIQETADAFGKMVRSLQLQEKKNQVLNQSLQRTSLSTIYRLSEAAEYRDNDTGAHISRMSRIATTIATALGQPEEFCTMLLYAAPMHDIGKIGIPDAILLKSGKLNDEEWKQMQTHAAIGASILKNPETEMLKMARNVALTHHEKWDGSGYPSGLKGEDIPLEGRICALADVVDALSSKRPYKEPFELDQVFEMIRKEKGHHFDPACVDAFFSKEAEIRELYSNLPS